MISAQQFGTAAQEFSKTSICQGSSSCKWEWITSNSVFAASLVRSALFSVFVSKLIMLVLARTPTTVSKSMLTAVVCRAAGIWPHQAFLFVLPMHTDAQLQNLLCMMLFVEQARSQTDPLTQYSWDRGSSPMPRLCKLLKDLGCKQAAVTLPVVMWRTKAMMHAKRIAAAWLSNFTSTTLSTCLHTVFQCCFSRPTMQVGTVCMYTLIYMFLQCVIAIILNIVAVLTKCQLTVNAAVSHTAAPCMSVSR